MRAIVQRVISSSVIINSAVVGKINKGINVLVGISKEDTPQDIMYIKDKILNLRIFEDENGKLNKSLLEVKGELLVVSQFTLYGDCRKGRRPSFIEALSGEAAEELYNTFVSLCKESIPEVQTGVFGADMIVQIENEGPVTLMLDSKKAF
jgi:D-tyrosyl-tRNA(Tyr) deacylase